MNNMDSKILIVIIVICAGLILFGIINHKFDLIVNFLLRVAMGLVGIYLLNTILQSFNLSLGVGINATTTLLIGLLGLPGFIVVYGIAVYFYLK